MKSRCEGTGRSSSGFWCATHSLPGPARRRYHLATTAALAAIRISTYRRRRWGTGSGSDDRARRDLVAQVLVTRLSEAQHRFL
jgi:hypothetical protein